MRSTSSVLRAPIRRPSRSTDNVRIWLILTGDLHDEQEGSAPGRIGQRRLSRGRLRTPRAPHAPHQSRTVRGCGARSAPLAAAPGRNTAVVGPGCLRSDSSRNSTPARSTGSRRAARGHAAWRDRRRRLGAAGAVVSADRGSPGLPHRAGRGLPLVRRPRHTLRRSPQRVRAQ
jgi:hypothetical protein